MPKVISYTPTWLSRPSPGYHLFSKPSASQHTNGSISNGQNGANIAKQFLGNRRTIARRGTELFVVVDNEIRWSDLCMLKDVWENTQREPNKREKDLDKREESNGNYGLADKHVADVSYRVRDLCFQGSQSICLNG